MAFITYRTSRGKKYWSIVESRRINGKPKQVILDYLGTAETLLQRLQDQGRLSLKSYSHGDTSALVTVAKELDLINIINRHIPSGEKGGKPRRDGLTVGASFLLAALGRACQPTSKRGWYQWCKTTSLEYYLGRSFRKLDSQHFWDQMGFLPEEKIRVIEEEIIKRLAQVHTITPETLLFDTSNFFTFIASQNGRCQLPRRGKNKQKRSDLRQIGLAFLITRKEQFPLFHQTYEGNKSDVTVFKEVLADMVARLRNLFRQLADITLIFDKGNNSRDNFKLLDSKEGLGYVGGLVPCYFKELIKEANQHFQTITIQGETVPVYRIKKKIWGAERTCVVLVSRQLKEGQIRGIHQQLEKKYGELEAFKRRLENRRRQRKLAPEEIRQRLAKMIKGQFLEEILKYDLIELEEGASSFTYYVDSEAFERLEQEMLGRRILVTNRHHWSSEQIITAYRGQAKVEYAFRCLKNPYHLCVRPQYHWTDQKIRAHIFICLIGYLLTIVAYSKARKEAGYRKNLGTFLEELSGIRLACRKKSKSNKVSYQLESIPPELRKVAKLFGITNDNVHGDLKLSVYN